MGNYNSALCMIRLDSVCKENLIAERDVFVNPDISKGELPIVVWQGTLYPDKYRVLCFGDWPTADDFVDCNILVEYQITMDGIQLSDVLDNGSFVAKFGALTPYRICDDVGNSGYGVDLGDCYIDQYDGTDAVKMTFNLAYDGILKNSGNRTLDILDWLVEYDEDAADDADIYMVLRALRAISCGTDKGTENYDVLSDLVGAFADVTGYTSYPIPYAMLRKRIETN